MRIKDGNVIGYHYDKHITYLALEEDPMNNGLYRDYRKRGEEIIVERG
jgi:hypothetical protein